MTDNKTTPGAASDLVALRHSTAHVMAAAVVELFPGTKIGLGPPTDDGFFYDFDPPRPLTGDDLAEIERRMGEIIASDLPFVRRSVEASAAAELLADQPYKVELIDEITAADADAELSTYRIGGFEDLCKGPHVTRTGDIDPAGLKLLSISGAYWRGDEARPQMQRVHGTVWSTATELNDHLAAREEARERDHKALGDALDLFAFDPAIGPGLPLWLPEGTAIRDALEDWARETERAWGYRRISTPLLTRAELYELSGHLPYFADDMFAPIQTGGASYYVRPMNCPHHMAVFRARPHSYRDLPLRLAEYGQVYRYERSGELNGLLRARGMTQNDAHIFCRMSQALEEFVAVMRLHAYYYGILGITDYHMVLALRDPANVAKYHDDEDMWAAAEAITRQAMEESAIDYVEEPGGAAHYGPKVDFVVRSATGRAYGASTNQLDLYLPARFDLEFTNEHNAAERPVVIHRAPLGSHERFIGFLIEHYAGAFPPWLAPIQVGVVPIGDDQAPYARDLSGSLFALGYRVDALPAGTVGAAIRSAEHRKIPFLAIVGAREMAAGTVSVRARGGRQLGEMSVAAFFDALGANVAAKSREAALG